MGAGRLPRWEIDVTFAGAGSDPRPRNAAARPNTMIYQQRNWTRAGWRRAQRTQADFAIAINRGRSLRIAVTHGDDLAMQIVGTPPIIIVDSRQHRDRLARHVNAWKIFAVSLMPSR